MLARKVVDSQPLVAELAGYISSEVNRLNALVVRFLDFARPSKLELRPENIAKIVDRALEAAAASFPDTKVKIERQYAQDLPEVDVDTQLCEQVFVNLITNAFQAMDVPDASTDPTLRLSIVRGPQTGARCLRYGGRYRRACRPSFASRFSIHFLRQRKMEWASDFPLSPRLWTITAARFAWTPTSRAAPASAYFFRLHPLSVECFSRTGFRVCVATTNRGHKLCDANYRITRYCGGGTKNLSSHTDSSACLLFAWSKPLTG